MLLGLVTLAAAGTLADCPQTWRASDLTDVVTSADLYLAKLDPDGFAAANQTLLTRLACVNEPLDGPQIGAVHRIEATAAFLGDQNNRIAPALAGLLAADPGYQLPPSLYPEGHPIRELLPHASILARDDATRRLVQLPSGWLEVDGRPSGTAPSGRAAIIQQIGGDGQVIETRYVWPEDTLGAWAYVPGAGTEGKVSAKASPPSSRSHGARVPLLLGTAVSLAGTGVLFGVAEATATRFRTDDTLDDDELTALAGRANGLTIGYAAAGAAALGLGIGLVVSW